MVAATHLGDPVWVLGSWPKPVAPSDVGSTWGVDQDELLNLGEVGAPVKPVFPFL